MRIAAIAIAVLLLTTVAHAQQPTPTPTLIVPVETPRAAATEAINHYGPPRFLSGVGATPLSANVNIRSGPGIGYRVIGVLELGESIDVVGTNGFDQTRSCAVPFQTTLDMWITVQFGERRGWIARCTVAVTGDMTNLLVQPEAGR